MKKQILLVVSVALLLALSACGGAAQAGAPQTTYDIDMADFSFMPMAYTVPAGEEITFNLTNSGAVLHEIVIMKFGTKVTTPFDDDDQPNIYWEHEVDAGKSESVTFTAPSEPGTYEVVCGISGHMESGMVATMTVVVP